MAHTPGPWKVHGSAGYSGHRVADVNGRSTASFPSTSSRPHEERNANAVLIAAAPDLLAALTEAVKVCGNEYKGTINTEEEHSWVSIARKAIAKAKGE